MSEWFSKQERDGWDLQGRHGGREVRELEVSAGHVDCGEMGDTRGSGRGWCDRNQTKEFGLGGQKPASNTSRLNWPFSGNL